MCPVFLDHYSHDDPQIKQLYQQAAQEHCPEGQVGFALTAAAEENWPQAIQSFQALAEKQEPLSQLAIAALYITGKAGAKMIPEGAKLLLQLADKSQLPKAQHYCALFYETGSHNFPKNNRLAIRYYQLAAKQNDPKALYALGRINETNKQFEQAFDYYQKAACNNYLDAKYKTACFLMMGQGTPSDINEAVKLLQQLSQEEHLDATFDLGYLYTFGGLVEKNTRKGRTLLKTAAKKGHGQASYRLARIEASELVEHINVSIINTKFSAPVQAWAESKRINLGVHCQEICAAIKALGKPHTGDANDTPQLLKTVTESSKKVGLLVNLCKLQIPTDKKYQVCLDRLQSVQRKLEQLQTTLSQQTAVSSNAEVLTTTKNSALPSQRPADPTRLAHSITTVVKEETDALLPAESGNNAASYPSLGNSPSHHDKKP